MDLNDVMGAVLMASWAALGCAWFIKPELITALFMAQEPDVGGDACPDCGGDDPTPQELTHDPE